MKPEQHSRHKPLPPVDLLRELYHYDENNGVLLRKKPRRGVKVGQVVGCMAANGYITLGIRINRKQRRYAAHRVMYAIFYGEDPGLYEIDHIDGNRANNRINNLRLATRVQNLANGPARKTARCGFRGVSFFKPIRKWRADIKANGKQKCLGYFDDPEVAARAYDRAALEVFGEFARPNFPQENRA